MQYNYIIKLLLLIRRDNKNKTKKLNDNTILIVLSEIFKLFININWKLLAIKRKRNLFITFCF